MAVKDKIKVISNSDGRCGIDNAALRISRRWETRGAIVLFTKDELDELMFDAAFRNMVNSGILYIDDMEYKKAIGLEDPDAVEPRLKLIDDKELNRLWKIMPLAQFKLETKNMTQEQLVYLAEYAIEHGEDGAIDKADYLSKISGYNVLKGIDLYKANKEEVKKEG